jgi:tRNA dimethylallyltransferase
MLDGELSQGQAISSTAQGTRRLARKQLGWFRRDDRVTWLPADPDAAATIAAAVRGRVQRGIKEA